MAQRYGGHNLPDLHISSQNRLISPKMGFDLFYTKKTVLIRPIQPGIVEACD